MKVFLIVYGFMILDGSPKVDIYKHKEYPTMELCVNAMKELTSKYSSFTSISCIMGKDNRST